jgi:hypothetical protein
MPRSLCIQLSAAVGVAQLRACDDLMRAVALLPQWFGLGQTSSAVAAAEA